MPKYYCEKCKTNHNLNSKIGKTHRGIKVDKPKRKKYKVVLPDGQIYKTTSVYKYKYAVISYRAFGSRHNENMEAIYSDWKWSAELYYSKEQIEDRLKTIRKFQKEGHWMDHDLKSMKIIKLKPGIHIF